MSFFAQQSCGHWQSSLDPMAWSSWVRDWCGTYLVRWKNSRWEWRWKWDRGHGFRSWLSLLLVPFSNSEVCEFSFQKLVVANKDILTALRTSFDKPEQMAEYQKRLNSELNAVRDLPTVWTFVGIMDGQKTKANNLKLDLCTISEYQ